MKERYCLLLFLCITTTIIAMEKEDKNFEHKNLLSYKFKKGSVKKQIYENTKYDEEYELVPLENITTKNLSSEVQIKIADNTDPENCTICLEPFTFSNRRFKIEILDDEEYKDLHAAHASVFHKPCIITWMKEANTCPICRQILKDPISTRLKKTCIRTCSILKSILSHPLIWFWITVFLNYIIADKCPNQNTTSIATPFCRYMNVIFNISFWITIWRFLMICRR